MRFFVVAHDPHQDIDITYAYRSWSKLRNGRSKPKHPYWTVPNTAPWLLGGKCIHIKSPSDVAFVMLKHTRRAKAGAVLYLIDTFSTLH